MGLPSGQDDWKAKNCDQAFAAYLLSLAAKKDITFIRDAMMHILFFRDCLNLWGEEKATLVKQSNQPKSGTTVLD